MQQHSLATTSTAVACLLRIYWALAGPATLYLALATIAARGAPLPSHLDVVVWVSAALMLLARYVDITYHSGRTMTAEPADLGDWRRYAALTLGITFGCWIAAHSLEGGVTR